MVEESEEATSPVQKGELEQLMVIMNINLTLLFRSLDPETPFSMQWGIISQYALACHSTLARFLRPSELVTQASRMREQRD